MIKECPPPTLGLTLTPIKYILFSKYVIIMLFIKHHWNGFVFQKRACEHVIPSERHNMFASAQCLGYYLDHGLLTKELCYPPKETVLSQIKQEVKRRKVKAIFVATDSDDMKSDIEKVTKKKVWCRIMFLNFFFNSFVVFPHIYPASLVISIF